MRCLVILLILLTGCSRVDLSDLATTSGAVAGAAAGVATGIGMPAVVTLTAAGGVAGAALVEDGVAANDVCIEQPDVCNKVKFWETLMGLIHWIIGGTVGLIVIAWLIPGPQSLFIWRRKDAQSNNTDHADRRDRGN